MTMPVAAVKNFPWRLYGVVALAIAIFALWPLVSVFASIGVAQQFGCQLDEGSIHVCMIGGSDWGGALTILFVMGWFALLTLPVGLGAGLIWLAVLVVHRLAWSQRRGRAAT